MEVWLQLFKPLGPQTLQIVEVKLSFGIVGRVRAGLVPLEPLSQMLARATVQKC